MLSSNKKEQIALGVQVRLALFLIALLGAILWMQAIFSPAGPKVSVTSVESKRAVSAKEINRGEFADKRVTFTFDGGSGTGSADAILAALAKHKVKGTFFLTGRFVETNPALVRRVIAEGHEIFNHTYSHPHLTELSENEIMAELERMEHALRRVAGVSSAPFFRPPFGDRDHRVLAAAYKAGYQSVYWSVDARDWEESVGRTAAEVRDTILSNVYPGAIYLMHIGDSITGDVLDGLFSEIESKGYKIVSLTEGVRL